MITTGSLIPTRHGHTIIIIHFVGHLVQNKGDLLNKECKERIIYCVPTSRESNQRKVRKYTEVVYKLITVLKTLSCSIRGTAALNR